MWSQSGKRGEQSRGILASGGSTTLAYVKGQAGSSDIVSGSTQSSQTDYITYRLGLNFGAIKADAWDSGGREELEATIAYEMIHALWTRQLSLVYSANSQLIMGA